jgi:branched-subunit amino acid aminotransferase/4-amino-4-deoxychorismate lyase
MTAGLIRGDGAFDPFPVRDRRPFAQAAHLDRLERSCAALTLPCPREDIAAADEAFLASTGRWAPPISAIGETALRRVPGPHTLRAQAEIERAMAEGRIA